MNFKIFMILLGMILVSSLIMAPMIYNELCYDYPDTSGLPSEEVAGVKAGYRAGYQDAINGRDEITVVTGCDWGYGYQIGWETGKLTKKEVKK